MAEYDVVCVGSSVVDIPLRPVDASVFDTVSYPVDDISMQPGGDALNESIVLSKLGANVALVTAVGQDAAGDFIIDSAASAGVETEGVLAKPGMTTSMNVGLVHPDGERTFITNRNGSLWKTEESDLDIERALNGKILAFGSIYNNPLLGGEWIAALFKRAKEQGQIVCADMVPSRVGKGLEEIAPALAYVDYFFPNADEAVALTGAKGRQEALEILGDLGVGTVVMKTGREGCLVHRKGQTVAIPAFSRDDLAAIDTTGAGDNFAAGFIRALIDGLPVEECAAFANGTAAVSVGGLGATSGVKSKDQVDAFIAGRSESEKSE